MTPPVSFAVLEKNSQTFSAAIPAQYARQQTEATRQIVPASRKLPVAQTFVIQT